MFDTIAYTCFLALLPSEQWLKGWWNLRAEGNDGRPFACFERIIKHGLLGIRLFVQTGTGMVVKVEVDLPKLLYGHNGRLITTQAQVDRAFDRLKQALQTVCELASPHRGFHPGDLPGDTATHYTRIDLVWQFGLAAAFVFNALRNAKHPEIHKRKGEWKGQTLTFPGTKLYICIYDKKAKERACCEHEALRVEVRLHKSKIDQHFAVAEDDVLLHLPLDRAYAAYRKVLLGFGSDFVPDLGRKGTIEDFLALMVTKLPNDDPVGLYCLNKRFDDGKTNRLRKAVGLLVPRLVGFSWASLLPEGSLPPVVEIVDEDAEKAVEELFERLQPAAAPKVW